MSYKRGDVVILPFPFVTTSGTQQKARPALIISDHSIRRRFDDLILAGITSQRIDDVLTRELEKAWDFVLNTRDKPKSALEKRMKRMNHNHPINLMIKDKIEITG
jgi:arsenate reductase-like glutaredoxin family protein